MCLAPTNLGLLCRTYLEVVDVAALVHVPFHLVKEVLVLYIRDGQHQVDELEAIVLCSG